MKQQRIDDYNGRPVIAWRFATSEERAFYASSLEMLGAERVTYNTADCAIVLRFRSIPERDQHWDALARLSDTLEAHWNLEQEIKRQQAIN